MNAITQRNKLEIQLKGFKDFVPFCPSDGLLKLMSEMARIYLRIENLRECPEYKLKDDVPFYFETKQSKINFKTI
jgi:hypothetical protein